ncbi:putative ORFan [Tupanvirus deep ocean]|uniref:ORFan n=2 Tax=Tupanvirus TaxID=2094720 RepID=A0AC62A8R4_9VIRU|nr:putative ORFan [Tupanvirus deep ocean]QKU34165.1 putative ORFan [Tupanvirus deep ocean]
MKHLILYTNWKHDDEGESLRIGLDISLNVENKKYLLEYLSHHLEKNYDLTYEETFNNGAKFVLTMDELNTFLEKTSRGGEYYFGENIGGYLYPVGVKCLIKEDDTICLSKIKLTKKMDEFTNTFRLSKSKKQEKTLSNDCVEKTINNICDKIENSTENAKQILECSGNNEYYSLLIPYSDSDYVLNHIISNIHTEPVFNIFATYLACDQNVNQKSLDEMQYVNFLKKSLLKYFASNLSGNLYVEYPYYKNHHDKQKFVHFLVKKLKKLSGKHESKDILDALCGTICDIDGTEYNIQLRKITNS